MRKLRSAPSTIHVGVVAKTLWAFFAVALLAGTMGCNAGQKKQAQNLVEAGSATSQQLAEYYDTLRQRRADHMQLEKFRLRRADSELSEEAKKAYEGQLDALAARAEMARGMKATYDALGELIEYDAPGEVTGAVLELKEAIEDVSGKRIPGFAGADPGAALEKAISAFVGWQQIRQFRKNAPKATEVLEGVIKLYEGEKDIYVQISEDYYDLAHKTAKFLHERKQLSGTASFKSYAEIYGLQVLPELPQPTDDATRKYIVAVEAFMNDRLDARLKQLQETARKEADDYLEGLRILKMKHQDFIAQRKPESGGTDKAARHVRRPSDSQALELAAA